MNWRINWNAALFPNWGESIKYISGSQSYITHAHVDFVQRKSDPKNAIYVIKIQDEYFSAQLEIV